MDCKATLEAVDPHVWDVDGAPRGIVFRIEQSGPTLTAVIAGRDGNGAMVGDIRPPTTCAFADVVRVMQNATPAEWREIADRTAEPA
jgi:hypothetical protein